MVLLFLLVLLLLGPFRLIFHLAFVSTKCNMALFQEHMKVGPKVSEEKTEDFLPDLRNGVLGIKWNSMEDTMDNCRDAKSYGSGNATKLRNLETDTGCEPIAKWETIDWDDGHAGPNNTFHSWVWCGFNNQLHAFLLHPCVLKS